MKTVCGGNTQRLDHTRAKAASSGGVAFYLDRHVTERIMRHTYGVILDVPYHPEDPEHQDRSKDLKEDPNSGKKYVRGGFFALVTRVSQVYSISSPITNLGQSLGSVGEGGQGL